MYLLIAIALLAPKRQELPCPSGFGAMVEADNRFRRDDRLALMFATHCQKPSGLQRGGR